jgi:hypothetical protein
MAKYQKDRAICPADAPVGITIVILGFLFGIVVLILNALASLFVLSIFGPLGDRSALSTGFSGSGQAFAPPAPASSYPGWIMAAVLGVTLGYCILVIYCGFSVRAGNPRGLNLAIILFSLLTLSGNGLAVIGLAIAVYCVLRRAGVIRGVQTAIAVPSDSQGG